VLIALIALTSCVDALSDRALRTRLHRHHSKRARAMTAAEADAMGIGDWFKEFVNKAKQAMNVVRSKFADKNNQAALKANPKAKEAAIGKGTNPKVAGKPSGKEAARPKDKMKGVVFVAPDVFEQVRNSTIGATLNAAATALINAAQSFQNSILNAAGATEGASPSPAPSAKPGAANRNKPTAGSLVEEQAQVHAGADPSTIKCAWVYSEGSGNVPPQTNTDNPSPKCWSTWSWNDGSNEQCADYDVYQGPGPYQSAVAERYGKGFTCLSDEQRSTPGTKEGQRVDNVAFICRDGNGARVQTPAKCKPKIYMQAAFYGQAKTSTDTLSVCPLGDRKMNAFAGVEAAWTVGSTTVFNKGAMTQSGNEITEHYSVALGPKASLNGQGGGAELGVTIGMTTDVKNDFKDTKAAAFVIGTHEIQETAMSILKSSATVTMTAAGRVAGSAEVSTLGLGVWYVMEAQGVTAADCKGAATTYNYFITGNDKFEEIKQTAKRFFASRQVQTEL